MSAYRNLVRQARATIVIGKAAAMDIRNGDYADPTSLDFAIVTDMGDDSDYNTFDDLARLRAAGYRAARQLRGLTGHTTLADIASMRVAGAPTSAPYAL